MAITLFGLGTCDTCKTALKALRAGGHAPVFHDVRADDVTPDMLARWLDAFGWERVLNRRSTSFRALEAAQTRDLDRDRAMALMLETPTLIKRPVIETPAGAVIGYGKAEQARLKDLLG